MSGASTFSVIGADVTIRGDVAAAADLHVDGRVEGDISCASLVQGATSEVHGQVEAETARLAGRVVGSIQARELVILKTARIEGDVHYDALTIEQGAEVEGRFSHRLPVRPAAAASPGGRPALAQAPQASGENAGDEPRLTLAS